MDTVFIRELRADAVIGVYDWERSIRQTLVLDLEMAWDNRPAAAGDTIGRALDYAAVSGRVIEYIEGSSYQLLETLAENLAALVLSEFGVPWLRLRLCKPGAVQQARDVGVLIERGARPA
ncbi:dihydroneopterin aldolase [Haliea sp. E1-2-M8]|uniref:dihydroneopterin aldolase n=1 Tax=Haliea sp. E1-2-M8 TaxID=3064706 RepID=UPI00271AA36C|nr:dihydroneopterin aldolase [Haliea sp. E1-2-M8]MDO8861092.1 dihydroneopterin aldolase [Haliea sp. E1-2-M8]